MPLGAGAASFCWPGVSLMSSTTSGLDTKNEVPRYVPTSCEGTIRTRKGSNSRRAGSGGELKNALIVRWASLRSNSLRSLQYQSVGTSQAAFSDLEKKKGLKVKGRRIVVKIYCWLRSLARRDEIGQGFGMGEEGAFDESTCWVTPNLRQERRCNRDGSSAV